MRIDGLGLQNITQQVGQTSRQTGDIQTPFGNFLNAYMNMLGETSRLETNALNHQLDLVTGRSDDILAVMLAQEKAMISLNFTVQVTNRILDAYREIMRVAM